MHVLGLFMKCMHEKMVIYYLSVYGINQAIYENIIG